MNIVMFSKYFYPHIGGVERHVENVCNILEGHGHKIAIITEKYDENINNIEVRQGVKIVRLNYPRVKFLGLLYIWYWLFKNRRLITRADIVHIHDVFVWYLPYRVLFPLKKVFMTFHGYPSYPIGKKAIIFQMLAEKLTYGNICIGDFMKKWFSTKPTFTTYGAVNTKIFKPLRIKHKYNAIFSSRLDEQTGIFTYIDAIKILKHKGIDFNLLVLGDGKYRDEAEKIAECIGFVNNPSPYFKQAKFAFVNRYLAILEAFASKKLVFAVYDNPLKKDYLEMAPFSSWMIVEKDPKKLAEKIEYFISNPQKVKHYTDPAYQWVKNQTWERLVGDYLSLWGVGEKPSPSKLE